MSRDYTRWNRAGLRRFRYTNANAATYLEDLRRALGRRLPQWERVAAELDPELDELGIAERAAHERAVLARLREQYEEPSSELAWELGRAYVRACHVLGEHLDAYANEGFIGTATQWDSVRRLVGMLDYHPRAPASASTFLVVQCREHARGRLDAGALQVSHAPADGGDPVVFENLEALELDARLDSLRPASWDRSPLEADLRDMVWRPPGGAKLGGGSEVIAVNEASAEGFATRVERLVHGRLELEGAPEHSWPLAHTVLWSEPRGVRECQLRGPRVLRLGRGHGLALGDVVAWFDDDDSSWRFNEVEATDGVSARLRHALTSWLEDGELYEAEGIPAVPVKIGRARVMGPSSGPSPLTLPLQLTALAWREDEGLEHTEDIDIWTTLVTPDGEAQPTHREPIGLLAGKRLFIIADDFTATLEAEPSAQGPFARVGFEGTPGGWKTGQWFMGEGPEGVRIPLCLRELGVRDHGFEATFEPAVDEPLVRVHGPLASMLRPEGWDRDTTLVTGARLLLASLPTAGPALRGRRILLRWPAGAHPATILAVNGAVLSFDPPLPATLGVRRFELELHANVVLAGHGARKPGKILGSGDATSASQRFILDVPELSFVADVSRESGVRAALELEVEGRRWRALESLRSAGPTDEVFVVRVREDGGLSIHTGDGQQGRRLPSGVNNVRVGYRQGAGLSGNLPPGSLTELERPHVLVEEVLQLLPASGGNDRDGLELLREDASSTVLTLGRAVGLDDFARLAAGHSTVWQASAISRPAARGRERVQVIVVPAGGGVLGQSQRQLIEEFLAARTLPDVVVEVSGHQHASADLHIRVAVDPQSGDPQAVLGELQGALEASLSARRRKIGQSLHLAEVVEVVEGVGGVLHSGVVIDGELALRVRRARRDELLVLGELIIELRADTTRSVLTTSSRRPVERRSVLDISGVGPVLTEAFAGLEPRVTKIHELASLDPGMISLDFPTPIEGVRRLRARAAIVMRESMSDALISAEPSLSIMELLDYAPEALAARHGLSLDQALDAHRAGRRLQACLDEDVLAELTLAELTLDPQLTLGAVTPAQDKHARIGRRSLVEINGVDELTAAALGAPPLAKTTIAELARLDPDDARRRSTSLGSAIGQAPLWELQTKAQLVLDASWVGPKSSTLLVSSLAALIEGDDYELSHLGGLTDADLTRLRELLDLLELSLDFAALTELTLEDFSHVQP